MTSRDVWTVGALPRDGAVVAGGLADDAVFVPDAGGVGGDHGVVLRFDNFLDSLSRPFFGEVVLRSVGWIDIGPVLYSRICNLDFFPV